MTACTLRQMAEVTSAEVRQGVLLEVSPDVLDRVEFGCIGGQELKDDGTTLRLHMLAHELGAMRQQPIPNDRRRLV